MTTSDSEWQRVTRSGTTSDNEWQRMATSNNKWQRVTANDNEWQRVTKVAQRVRTNHIEWQQMTMIDSEWQKVIQRVKKTHLLQKMDDCNSFYNKNTPVTSRDGWLILEWLNKLPWTSSKKEAGLNK